MRRAKVVFLLGLFAIEASVPWAFCGGKQPVHGVAPRNRLAMRVVKPMSPEEYMNEAKAAGYSVDDIQIGEDSTYASIDFLPKGMESFTFEWIGGFVSITVAIAFVIFIATPLMEKMQGKEVKLDFKKSRIGRILAGEAPMSIPEAEDSLGFTKQTIAEIREERKREGLDPITWLARPDLRPKEESEQGKTDATPSKESKEAK